MCGAWPQGDWGRGTVASAVRAPNKDVAKGVGPALGGLRVKGSLTGYMDCLLSLGMS